MGSSRIIHRNFCHFPSLSFQFTRLSIPSLDALAYQADRKAAACVLNQSGRVKMKASKAWVSFKCRKRGFEQVEETPFAVTWGFGTDH